MKRALDVPAHVTEHDRGEIERFADFLRRVGDAKKAGATHAEAVRSIYPDTFPSPDPLPR